VINLDIEGIARSVKLLLLFIYF